MGGAAEGGGGFTDNESTDEDVGMKLLGSGKETLDKRCIRVESNIRRDHRCPPPELDTDGIENVPSSFIESGIITLGPLIGESKSSRVFSIIENDRTVIKYQSNCEDRYRSHPLTREYMIMQRISDLGISPRVYSLSDGVYLDPSNERIPSKANTGAYRNCKKPNPTLRYLIMERVGESLNDYVESNGPLSVNESIRIGCQLIQHLQKLHSLDIVHGDIFQRNVCFKDSGDLQNLVMIDFGRSIIVSRTSAVARSYISTFPLFTHWEMQGYRSSYRDDLFRVLQLMAYLMNGSKYMTDLFILSSTPFEDDTDPPIMSFKERGFIFELNGLKPITEAIHDVNVRSTVKQGLRQVLDFTRSLKLDQLPDYDSILATMQPLIDLEML